MIGESRSDITPLIGIILRNLIREKITEEMISQVLEERG